MMMVAVVMQSMMVVELMVVRSTLSDSMTASVSINFWLLGCQRRQVMMYWSPLRYNSI